MLVVNSFNFAMCLKSSLKNVEGERRDPSWGPFYRQKACGQGTVQAQARQRLDGTREAGPGLGLQDSS